MRKGISPALENRLMDFRVTGFADTTENDRPSFKVKLQIRWSNPELNLDLAQSTFEKWIEKSNLRDELGASKIDIKSLLYA
mmetsp:Transcript_12449/g.17311  ORF Transcript_12449/g.17311 Transcript_12449/m.17311 type:complete len:81 (-) Transcript_12449:76-318(-)